MPHSTQHRPTATSLYELVTDTSAEAHIGSRIKIQPSGCWLYSGDRVSPYGHTKILGQNVLVHRFVYETLRQPIPEGHHLHHTCETKRCVNPDHLVPLTPSDHSNHHAQLRRQAAAPRR